MMALGVKPVRGVQTFKMAAFATYTKTTPPAFGASNQLLAALALLVAFAWLRSQGRRTTFVLVPMVFMCATTLTALVQLFWKHIGSHWFAGGKAGSPFVGGVSLVLFVLAVMVVSNTAWRQLRSKPGCVPPES